MFITSTYIFYCISLFIRSKDEIEIQFISKHNKFLDVGFYEKKNQLL